MKKQYFVVGATFGTTDMYSDFIENNIWYMGWREIDNTASVKKYFTRISKIRVGDNIAIKRLRGKGQSDINILAIGEVTKIVKDILFVNWVKVDMDRTVPINGCVGTVYGPYMYENIWTREVFCL